MSHLREHAAFFREFRQRFETTGSIVPSSRFLAAAMVRPLAARAADGRAVRVLEIGPGTGAVTRAILPLLGVDDRFDLVELNEAFAAQCVALQRELDLDPAKLNVHGGAVALGHPIGASGARVLTTLLHAMIDRGATRGLAALCLGGGNAVAMGVERI